jgi:hypothetical protein
MPYERTNWVNGDLISSERMNKIERQLELVTSPALGALRYDVAQTLTHIEQAQAKQNLNIIDNNYDNYYHQNIIQKSGKKNILIPDAAAAPLKGLKIKKAMPDISGTPDAPNYFNAINQIVINKKTKGAIIATGKDLYANNSQFSVNKNIITGALKAFTDYKISLDNNDLEDGATLIVNVSTANNCTLYYTYNDTDSPNMLQKLYGLPLIMAPIPYHAGLKIWIGSMDTTLSEDTPITIQDFSITWDNANVNSESINIINLSSKFYGGEIDLINGTIDCSKIDTTMGMAIRTNYSFIEGPQLTSIRFSEGTENEAPSLTCKIPETISVISPAMSRCSHYVYNITNKQSGCYTIDTIEKCIILYDDRFTNQLTAENILKNTDDLIVFKVVTEQPQTISFDPVQYNLTAGKQLLSFMDQKESPLLDVSLEYCVDFNALIDNIYSRLAALEANNMG